MYHLTEAYLMAFYISALAAFLGALIFGTAVVAPLAVRLISAENSPTFLRQYWVRFHNIAVIGSLLFTAMAGIGSVYSAVPIYYSMLLVGMAALMTMLFFIAMALIARINAASDAGNAQAFAKLHALNIACVGLGMVVGLALVAALIYVLPGQFTFWPTQTLPT